MEEFEQTIDNVQKIRDTGLAELKFQQFREEPWVSNFHENYISIGGRSNILFGNGLSMFAQKAAYSLNKSIIQSHIRLHPAEETSLFDVLLSVDDLIDDVISVLNQRKPLFRSQVLTFGGYAYTGAGDRLSIADHYNLFIPFCHILDTPKEFQELTKTIPVVPANFYLSERMWNMRSSSFGAKNQTQGLIPVAANFNQFFSESQHFDIAEEAFNKISYQCENIQSYKDLVLIPNDEKKRVSSGINEFIKKLARQHTYKYFKSSVFDHLEEFTRGWNYIMQETTEFQLNVITLACTLERSITKNGDVRLGHVFMYITRAVANTEELEIRENIYDMLVALVMEPGLEKMLISEFKKIMQHPDDMHFSSELPFSIFLSLNGVDVSTSSVKESRDVKYLKKKFPQETAHY